MYIISVCQTDVLNSVNRWDTGITHTDSELSHIPSSTS